MLRKLSPRARTILAVLVIALATVLTAFYAPPQKPSPILGPEEPETATVVNTYGSVTINRELEFQGVHITVKTAELADKFSDDKNRKGKYTLRVMIDAINNGNDVIGVPYADEVYLLLPDGQQVRTKRMSIKPAAMPATLQTGFLDYPLAERVDIANLKLAFSNGTVIPFK
jgi:hypothetical protein